MHRKDFWADVAAVVFGIIGGLALMFLSCVIIVEQDGFWRALIDLLNRIFNAFQYETAHWTLTAVFVVCIAISAVCQTLQTMWLERDQYVDHTNFAFPCR